MQPTFASLGKEKPQNVTNLLPLYPTRSRAAKDAFREAVVHGSVILSRWLLVAALGAVGACLRYSVGLAALKYLPGAPFVATLFVNLVGCFAFGVVSQLGDEVWWLTPELRVSLLAGLLGAFTTFSAFSYDTIALAETRGISWAAGYVLAQNVAGISLALWGMILGRSA